MHKSCDYGDINVHTSSATMTTTRVKDSTGRYFAVFEGARRTADVATGGGISPTRREGKKTTTGTCLLKPVEIKTLGVLDSSVWSLSVLHGKRRIRHKADMRHCSNADSQDT